MGKRIANGVDNITKLTIRAVAKNQRDSLEFPILAKAVASQSLDSQLTQAVGFSIRASSSDFKRLVAAAAAKISNMRRA